MTWIKRNLYFLISCLIAFASLGGAGWFFYSKWQLNNEILDQLNDQYGKLQNFNQQNPHPGTPKVDNIKAAKEEQQQMRDFLLKARVHFQRIAPIPDVATLSSENFSTALSRTIDQLQRDSTNASVTLPPPKYNFSFEAEKLRVSFDRGGLGPLAVQLGEVKAICDVLFAAGINYLDGIQRERVSADDASGSPSDYLADRSVTNDLAVLAPYELTFRCFTPELALVLSGFAASPHCLLVKTINVELAPAATPTTPEVAATPAPQVYQPPIYQPPPAFPPPGMPRGGEESEGYRRRYEQRYATPTTPAYAPPVIPQPVAPPPAAAGGPRGGLQTVIDEKQLKVTLMLEVVKLSGAK